MSIKGVLFDLEETLVERSLNNPEVFHRVLEQKGIYIPYEKVKKAVIEVKKEFGDTIEDKCGKIPRLDYHNLWSSHILEILGIEDHGKSILKEVSNRWIDICGFTLRPDAHSTLTALKTKGLKTGIISGAYEEEVRRILKTVGLDEHLFDVLVGADTIKRRKPDPAVFIHVLIQLKIEPEEALYVGDNLEKDYRAAERVGMNPLLLIKSDKGLPHDTKKIKTLIALMDYVD